MTTKEANQILIEAMIDTLCNYYGLEDKKVIKFCAMCEREGMPLKYIIKKYHKLMKCF